jgi:glycosyltransferase involved in cell wall biosynthesis
MADNLEHLLAELAPVVTTEIQQPVAEQHAAATTPVKFMLVGTHINQVTGYSKVTHHIVQELAKYPEIDVYHFAFQRRLTAGPDTHRTYPSNVHVYDPVEHEISKKHPIEGGFGFSQLAEYIRTVKPNYVMIYNDASVITTFLEKMESVLTEDEQKSYKLMIYLDQVYMIQRPDYLYRINKSATMFFVFTEHWKRVLEAQGIQKPIHVLRHGFDPAQFAIRDKYEVRKKHGISENAFLLLNLNRNTPRKHHDLVVRAFAYAVARNPTKPLLLMAICDDGTQGGGYLLHDVYHRALAELKMPIEIHGPKLLISKSPMTYTDDLVNDIYAMSDVGITAADGEGFGLCQFEGMGLGIPQIVSYVGGLRDFCNENNSKPIKPRMAVDLPIVYSEIGGVAEYIDPFEMSLAIEDYLMDSELREKHGKAARETVLDYVWAKEVKSLVDVLLEKEAEPAPAS